MSNFLSPYMYGDPNFRVPPTINNPNYMSPIIPFLPAIVGAFNGAVGAYGSAQQQRRAIANQWQMFEAQIKHQNAVNELSLIHISEPTRPY